MTGVFPIAPTPFTETGDLGLLALASEAAPLALRWGR
jgi:hypothetical protein